MHYIYVLRCRKPSNPVPQETNPNYGNGYYVGMTKDWKHRILRHLTHGGAVYTKKYKPISICHLEEMDKNELEARMREEKVRWLIKVNQFKFKIESQYLSEIQKIKDIYIKIKNGKACLWFPGKRLSWRL
jgi:predicted GIY-YIG superfamily endonuclease